jgi:hypothetical protein
MLPRSRSISVCCWLFRRKFRIQFARLKVAMILKSSLFWDVTQRRLAVTNCQSPLCNIPEERWSHLHRGGSLISGYDSLRCYVYREGSVWLLRFSGRLAENFSFLVTPRHLQLTNITSHIQIKKRLSCFATDNVPLKTTVTYALCVFSVMRSMDQNLSGDVRSPWVALTPVMK